jgi:hypothetical protein
MKGPFSPALYNNKKYELEIVGLSSDNGPFNRH